MPKLKLPRKITRPKSNLPWIVAGVVLLVIAAALYYQFVLNSPSHKLKKVGKLNGSGSNQQVDGDYSAAAQTYIKSYNKAPDASSRANAASNAAGAYEAAIKYQPALDWYNKALVAYKQAGDTSGVSSTQDSIKRVQAYLSPQATSGTEQSNSLGQKQ